MGNDVKSQLDEIVVSWWQYLDRSVPVIKGIADSFYKSIEQQQWAELPQLTEAFSWIYEVFESVEQVDTHSYEGWHAVKKEIAKLSGELLELNVAISTKDPVTIGDLLNYEVLPILKELRGTILTIIEQEVA